METDEGKIKLTIAHNMVKKEKKQEKRTNNTRNQRTNKGKKESSGTAR